MRTRMMALERELQRREKLLQQMMKFNAAGQGIGMDVIEKLREERNLLPIYRRKAQDLQAQIEMKDSEIQALKRDPQFTTIIELQVQFASWQHESKRLDSLLQEPSIDYNEAARHEIEVHERRVKALEEQLEKAKQKQDRLAGDLQEVEASHAEWEAKYMDSEQQLSKQQEETRHLAVLFKDLLQKRRHAERLEDEIKEMALCKRQFEAELKTSGSTAILNQISTIGRRAVSHSVLVGPLPSASSEDFASFWALRRAAARLSGDDSLFTQLLKREDAKDGLLTEAKLVEALEAVDSPLPPRELAGALVRWLQSRDADPGRIRWLDILVALDRLGGATGPSLAVACDLPDLRPLRAACLRTGTSDQELQRRLLEATTRAKAEAVFLALGISEAVTAAYMESWIAYGASGLVLRLPLSEAALPEATYRAWLGRCTRAVRKHRTQLGNTFRAARDDMILEEDQFRTIMMDVVGTELSENDLEDLVLLCGSGLAQETIGANKVDVDKVFKLAECGFVDNS